METKLSDFNLDILEVAAGLGLMIQTDGGQRHRCRCPVHQDNDPSLVLYRDNSWYCFGCQKGGDAVNLVRFVKRCSYDEALAWLGLGPRDALDRVMTEIDRARSVTESPSDPYDIVDRAEQARRFRRGTLRQVDRGDFQ